MYSPNPSPGIQTLLEAETEAHQIVNKARSYRAKRLEDAKNEAERQVKAYEATKDTEFKNYMQTESTQSEDHDAVSKKGIEDTIKSLEEKYNSNKDALTNTLLKVVTEVHKEPHKNSHIQF